MSYSIADLKANLIPSKTLENGAVVHPGLQIGEMTLQEHQDYLVWMKMQRPLTRSEAILAGHRPNEVYAHFGPLINDLKGQPSLELVALTRPEMEGFRQLNKAVPNTLDQFSEARAKGYTGDSCPDCGGFTMIHNGTCLVCDNCGRTTGCS